MTGFCSVGIKRITLEKGGMFGVIVGGVSAGILKFHTAVMPIKHRDEWDSGVSNSHTARLSKIPANNKNASPVQPKLSLFLPQTLQPS